MEVLGACHHLRCNFLRALCTTADLFDLRVRKLDVMSNLVQSLAWAVPDAWSAKVRRTRCSRSGPRPPLGSLAEVSEGGALPTLAEGGAPPAASVGPETGLEMLAAGPDEDEAPPLPFWFPMTPPAAAVPLLVITASPPPP